MRRARRISHSLAFSGLLFVNPSFVGWVTEQKFGDIWHRWRAWRGAADELDETGPITHEFEKLRLKVLELADRLRVTGQDSDEHSTRPRVERIDDITDSIAHDAVLSLVEATSALHFECSRAPFMDGADIWEYLPSKVYLRIQDDEAQDEIRRVQSWTVKDLPVDQQDETQVLRFKAKIQAYNPMRHPNMSITNQMKISIFCNGLHPDAKILALNMKNNLAQAQANNCCFPAVYPAGHPQAGAVHPQANQLSLDALAMYVHQQFSMKIRSGLVRLKGQPGVLLATSPNSEVDMSDVASELPVHKDAFLFA